MVCRSTVLVLKDNSAASKVRCFGFPFKSIKTRFIGLNDLVRVSLQKYNHRKFFLPKGKSRLKAQKLVRRMLMSQRTGGKLEKPVVIYFALILTTLKSWLRKDGTRWHAKKNRAILFNEEFKLLCSNAYGPFTRELRKKKKLLFISNLLLLGNRCV